MLRLTISLVFFLSICLNAQTGLYLEEAHSPGTVQDLVKLLNLKNAKKITIHSQCNDTTIFLGEIILRKNGTCFKKRSLTFEHTYDNEGNLTKDLKFSKRDSSGFSHYENKYNKKGHLTERIQKNKAGKIIDREKAPFMIYPFSYPVPLYEGNSNNYTYNSDGYLTKFFNKGFFRISSYSREDQERVENNKIEYNFKYNKYNQIVEYHMKLETTCTLTEVITKFEYINDNVIESKSIRKGKLRIICDKLLYKIEYY